MKKRALILVGLLCLASISFAYAQVSETYDLSWNVIGGGGGPTDSASYVMRSTVGQIIGLSSSDNHQLGAGYWYGYEAEAPPKKIEVTVSTDKTTYSPGDTMTTTVGFKNPTLNSVDTYFIWYFGLPDYGYWQQILVTPFTLPAGFDQSLDIPIDIGDWGAVGFDATWYVALLETAAPYEIISQDTADWRYVPTASTAEQEQEITLTPEEIATEIVETVERVEVELPGKKAQAQETVPVEIVEEIKKTIE